MDAPRQVRLRRTQGANQNQICVLGVHGHPIEKEVSLLQRRGMELLFLELLFIELLFCWVFGCSTLPVV